MGAANIIRADGSKRQQLWISNIVGNRKCVYFIGDQKGARHLNRRGNNQELSNCPASLWGIWLIHQRRMILGQVKRHIR